MRVLLIPIAALAAAPAAHAGPLPVRTEDDRAAPLAGRIDAVTNTVTVMRRRVERIGDLVGTTPGPPNEPLLEAQALAIAGLAEEQLCPAGRTGNAGGDVVIADDDRHGDDRSNAGLANQAQAVAIVLVQAYERLAGIVGVAPGPPNDAEAAAFTALYAEAAALVNQVSLLLGLELRLPPNPC